jgi:hypothetical protein
MRRRAPHRTVPRANADPPDSLRTAATVGLLAGVLALRWAYFDALSATLAACASASAFVRGASALRSVRRSAPKVLEEARRWIPLAFAVGLAWAFFVLAPEAIAFLRGVVLAGATAGLWWRMRRFPPPPEGSTP